MFIFKKNRLNSITLGFLCLIGMPAALVGGEKSTDTTLIERQDQDTVKLQSQHEGIKLRNMKKLICSCCSCQAAADKIVRNRIEERSINLVKFLEDLSLKIHEEEMLEVDYCDGDVSTERNYFALQKLIKNISSAIIEGCSDVAQKYISSAIDMTSVYNKKIADMFINLSQYLYSYF
ncbi:MAG: hypothetical protein HAW62_00130 [Endozoicomonadaceae bacterium]|nr:hypothetical protein [Endozoicomonadaceae bacterium]